MGSSGYRLFGNNLFAIFFVISLSGRRLCDPCCLCVFVFAQKIIPTKAAFGYRSNLLSVDYGPGINRSDEDHGAKFGPPIYT